MEPVGIHGRGLTNLERQLLQDVQLRPELPPPLPIRSPSVDSEDLERRRRMLSIFENQLLHDLEFDDLNPDGAIKVEDDEHYLNDDVG